MALLHNYSSWVAWIITRLGNAIEYFYSPVMQNINPKVSEILARYLLVSYIINLNVPFLHPFWKSFRNGWMSTRGFTLLARLSESSPTCWAQRKPKSFIPSWTSGVALIYFFLFDFFQHIFYWLNRLHFIQNKRPWKASPFLMNLWWNSQKYGQYLKLTDRAFFIQIKKLVIKNNHFNTKLWTTLKSPRNARLNQGTCYSQG